MHIGNREINGVECEIHATERHGQWFVRHNGNTVGVGDKLDNAIAQARTALNKQRIKVSVPFWTVEGATGEATGIHGGTRQVLARVNGKATQFSPGTSVLRGDTPPEKVEALVALNARIRDARQEANAIQHAYSLRLGTAVQEALDEAAKARELANVRGAADKAEGS